jgi:hypothetical protein
MLTGTVVEFDESGIPIVDFDGEVTFTHGNFEAGEDIDAAICAALSGQADELRLEQAKPVPLRIEGPGSPALDWKSQGRLAQLGEHQLDKLGVTGSSPVPPIS